VCRAASCLSLDPRANESSASTNTASMHRFLTVKVNLTPMLLRSAVNPTSYSSLASCFRIVDRQSAIYICPQQSRNRMGSILSSALPNQNDDVQPVAERVSPGTFLCFCYPSTSTPLIDSEQCILTNRDTRADVTKQKNTAPRIFVLQDLFCFAAAPRSTSSIAWRIKQ
jgi:hypothetical protein